MTDTLSLLKLRRSVPPQFLSGPGPSEAELTQILTVAARVPDHGKLAPWRFILFSGAGQEKAAEIVGTLFKQRNPQADEEKVAFERKRLLHAPLVVAVVSRARPHEKIPEWEQVLSAGAVCMNMLIAAEALGFAGSWLTNWFAFDREVLAAFGLEPEERIAGFVHLGRADGRPADRERPELSAIASRFEG
jgi:nitroreductase